MPTKSVAARIEARIHVIRGERVMLDADLAVLYGVETKVVNRAVSRNRGRFPADFMFRLTVPESHNLKYQFGTSSLTGHGGRRKLPYACTEQGVAMLSSVLRSERAVAVNILIMRTFVQLRRTLSEPRAGSPTVSSAKWVSTEPFSRTSSEPSARSNGRPRRNVGNRISAEALTARSEISG